MEIHSSSLTRIPTGYIAKNKKDVTLVPTINTAVQEQAPLNLPSPQDIEDKLKNANLLQLTSNEEHPKNKPTDSRTARAINAYIQEDIYPLQNQRSELISGIDFFV
jgi:hypothetical protein